MVGNPSSLLGEKVMGEIPMAICACPKPVANGESDMPQEFAKVFWCCRLAAEDMEPVKNPCR